jgi:hypothetical protein
MHGFEISLILYREIGLEVWILLTPHKGGQKESSFPLKKVIAAWYEEQMEKRIYICVGNKEVWVVGHSIHGEIKAALTQNKHTIVVE